MRALSLLHDGDRCSLRTGLLLGVLIVVVVHPLQADGDEIPRAWDQEAIDTLELPRPHPGLEVRHISSEEYYALPVRPIYRSYPVYRPDREPAGYWEKLLAAEPEIVWGPEEGLDERDPIAWGEVVFDAPIGYDVVVRPELVRNPAWHERVAPPVDAEGVVPGIRYVVRERGKVEVGAGSCGMCHTRVLPGGLVVKGAQGNFPFEAAVAHFIRSLPPARHDFVRTVQYALFAAPWLEDDPVPEYASRSPEEIARIRELAPPGTLSRQRSSPFFPLQIPDLIGIEDRRYLDQTGLVRHRGIGDLMRYAAMNQGMDSRSSYGGWVPVKQWQDAGSQARYSDAQLYALARYLYSLKPPPNPHPFDERAQRGQQIFARESCATCHTPPLYTNNKLTIATGFEPPTDHYERFDVMEVEVGTDPTTALKTGRSTGYYKVPSLEGVWYRGPFEHNGSVATLEDWFDPARLRDDYVPTGFRGYGVTTRAVPGHAFGLDLTLEERADLIAFLKTL